MNNYEKDIFTYITTKQTSTFKQFYHLTTDKDEPDEIFPKAKNKQISLKTKKIQEHENYFS